ncbi:MAG: hypothetical protein ABFS23_11555 [Pseudomonadota bacterium]
MQKMSKENLMCKQRLIAAALTAFSIQSAGATEIAAEWTFDDFASVFNFRLDLQSTDVAGVYTLNGYMELPVGGKPREAVVGSATYSPNEDVFAVSLFFNSNSGESFTIGANLDPVTLSGDGTEIRVTGGVVGSEKTGILAVVPIE